MAEHISDTSHDSTKYAHTVTNRTSVTNCSSTGTSSTSRSGNIDHHRRSLCTFINQKKYLFKSRPMHNNNEPIRIQREMHNCNILSSADSHTIHTILYQWEDKLVRNSHNNHLHWFERSHKITCMLNKYFCLRSASMRLHSTCSKILKKFLDLLEIGRR